VRDITDILEEWPYDSDSSVRKITGDDGRELLQVRTPLGIEQYELSGRPDGARPYGSESVLEHVEAERRAHIDAFGDTDEFEIDAGMASELQQEGLVYYYRYLVCFQVGEYEIVAQDTRRNLRMFDLMRAHCRDEEVVNGSEQYRPYVLRMNAAAEALQAVGRGEHDRARAMIQRTLDAIDRLPDVPTATFDYEKERSLAILRGMRKAIPEAPPATQEERLERELARVVNEEDYERAAEIRDQLRQLTARRGPAPSRAPESTSNDE